MKIVKILRQIRDALLHHPPRKELFIDAGTERAWHNLSISAGDATLPKNVFGYNNVTIVFKSDTAGTLTIDMLSPTGDWMEYDTVSIDADTPEPYPLGASLYKVRLSFDTAASVTAFLIKQ